MQDGLCCCRLDNTKLCITVREMLYEKDATKERLDMPQSMFFVML